MKSTLTKIIVLIGLLNFSVPAFGNGNFILSETMRFDVANESLLAANNKKGSRRPTKSKSRQNDTVVTSSTEGSKSESKLTPKMTIEANPLGLVLGMFNAEVNFKMNDHVTVGPLGSYVRYSFMSGFGAGGAAYYYFDSLFQNWFVTAGGLYSKSSGALLGYTIDVSGFTLYGMGGYKWLWKSFLLSLGGGLQINSFSVSSTYTAEDGTTEPETAFKLPISTVGTALMFNIGIPIH